MHVRCRSDSGVIHVRIYYRHLQVLQLLCRKMSGVFHTCWVRYTPVQDRYYVRTMWFSFCVILGFIIRFFVLRITFSSPLAAVMSSAYWATAPALIYWAPSSWLREIHRNWIGRHGPKLYFWQLHGYMSYALFTYRLPKGMAFGFISYVRIKSIYFKI